MRYLREIKHRQRQAKELYLKALRSGHFTLDVGKRGFTRHTQTQVKVQQRQFLVWLAAYHQVLQQMGWWDRLLYGSMIRNQVVSLAELKEQVRLHVNSLDNPTHHVEHIDLSMLPEYVEAIEVIPPTPPAFQCG